MDHAQRRGYDESGQDAIEYDRENELQFNPSGIDPKNAPHATIVTGLPKRQYRLHVGSDVAVPTDDDDGEWFDTSDGDAETTETGVCRTLIDAPMQQAGVPSDIRERVHHCLEEYGSEKEGNAWSFAGGWKAAAIGVLAALDYSGYAEAVSEGVDTNGYGVGRLKAQADTRELVR